MKLKDLKDANNYSNTLKWISEVEKNIDAFSEFAVVEKEKNSWLHLNEAQMGVVLGALKYHAERQLREIGVEL